jgi:hypothetical protein
MDQAAGEIVMEAAAAAPQLAQRKTAIIAAAAAEMAQQVALFNQDVNLIPLKI